MSRRPVPEGGCRPVPLRKGNRKRLNGPPGIPFFARRTGPRSPSGLVPGGERRNRGLKHKRRAVRMQRKFPAVPGKGRIPFARQKVFFLRESSYRKLLLVWNLPFRGKVFLTRRRSRCGAMFRRRAEPAGRSMGLVGRGFHLQNALGRHLGGNTGHARTAFLTGKACVQRSSRPSDPHQPPARCLSV